MIDWLKSVVTLRRMDIAGRPRTDREVFEQREAALRERHARLERLAIEADVISRAETAEEPQSWDTP